MVIFGLFTLQDISRTMETFVLFSFLIYVASIVAVAVVVIAIWRGMRAHERMADSMERMAEAAERMEETIRRNGEPRA
jgi:flagellar biosynthesis/type III secretory pathway M-ring protein FliF/YscJ